MRNGTSSTNSRFVRRRVIVPAAILTTMAKPNVFRESARRKDRLAEAKSCARTSMSSRSHKGRKAPRLDRRSLAPRAVAIIIGLRSASIAAISAKVARKAARAGGRPMVAALRPRQAGAKPAPEGFASVLPAYPCKTKPGGSGLFYGWRRGFEQGSLPCRGAMSPPAAQDSRLMFSGP